jgi:hypothetical protein
MKTREPFETTTSLAVLLLAWAAFGAEDPGAATVQTDKPVPETLYVAPAQGNDQNSGDKVHPLRTISAAIARLPELLKRTATIHLFPGVYSSTGGRDMAGDSLELMRRMRPGVAVRLVGQRNQQGALPVLAWEGGAAIVQVHEGNWSLENVQIGSGTLRQRRGVAVQGPGQLTLKDVTFRTRSLSDAGIYAHRGGKVSLRGTIKLNEHLHDQAGAETFAGIIALDHGLVQFAERKGASLDLGNGSLSASYYGVIELGCESARVTGWGEQTNPLAINNGGRIDLHSTPLRICAKQPRNTPVGLEHDGHILAEAAHLVIEGTNHTAIVLQKASTLTCNDIELRGEFPQAIAAMSGSMFVGCFVGKVTAVSASTGATVNLEGVEGNIVGPVTATRGGLVSLPNRTVFSK